MISDFTDIRNESSAAALGFASVVAGIAPHQWDNPGLGVWTVRDLTGHTSRALLTVQSYLRPGLREAAPALLDAVAYFGATTVLADPASVAERGRQAGAALGADPSGTIASLTQELLSMVNNSPDDTQVLTPVGTMTLARYLPSRTFELVVHTLDLVAATNSTPAASSALPLRAALSLAVDLSIAKDLATDVVLALTGRRTLPPGFTVV